MSVKRTSFHAISAQAFLASATLSSETKTAIFFDLPVQ
jgi:hypothetical protein